MIYYAEEKNGRKSIYKKVVTDESDKVISERRVEIPLYKIEKEGQPWFLLYDDDMNVLSLPSSYLNFDMSDCSLNTRRANANALRMLYVFLSLSNYDIKDLGQGQLNELIRFLQGLNSNPETFKTETLRSNDTVNDFLAVYRTFFRKKNIKSSALFDAKIKREEFTFGNDAAGITERLTYRANLRTADPNAHTVPKYISPDEFETLNRLAVAKKDKRAMCIMRLMYCYGLRLGEVLGLTTEDIHETHRNNVLVPTIILRNRMSDKDFQYCKNLGHVDKPEMYHSREYTKSKHVIVIDYPLYELICDYINEAHQIMGELLNDFLKRNRKDENTISTTLNKNLKKVEETILSRRKEIADAKKKIQENSINIKAIAEATGIARKTFYNNDLLVKLVEENLTEDTSRSDEIKRLKTRLADAETKLAKVLERDVETEILRHQIDKLQAELKTSHKRIKTLEEQHEEDLRKQNVSIIKKKEFFDA